MESFGFLPSRPGVPPEGSDNRGSAFRIYRSSFVGISPSTKLPKLVHETFEFPEFRPSPSSAPPGIAAIGIVSTHYDHTASPTRNFCCRSDPKLRAVRERRKRIRIALVSAASNQLAISQATSSVLRPHQFAKEQRQKRSCAGRSNV